MLEGLNHQLNAHLLSMLQANGDLGASQPGRLLLQSCLETNPILAQQLKALLVFVR
jgi:hypothetical protein